MSLGYLFPLLERAARALSVLPVVQAGAGIFTEVVATTQFVTRRLGEPFSEMPSHPMIFSVSDFLGART